MRRVALLTAPLLATAALAAPAATPVASAATTNTCSYTVKDSPTPIHAYASANSAVVRWKYRGQIVTGPCEGTTVIGPNGTMTWIKLFCSAGPGGYAWVDDTHLY